MAIFKKSSEKQSQIHSITAGTFQPNPNKDGPHVCTMYDFHDSTDALKFCKEERDMY